MDEPKNRVNLFLNLFFDSYLKAYVSPTLKKKPISKVLQLKEKHNLVDIWRIS